MTTEHEDLIKRLKRKTYDEMYQIVLYGTLPLDFTEYGWTEDEWIQEHSNRKSESLKKLLSRVKQMNRNSTKRAPNDSFRSPK